MGFKDVDWPVVVILSAVIILSIFLIAFTSIGLEAYNQDIMKTFKKKMKESMII